MAESSEPLHQAIWKNDENAFTSCLEKRESLNTEDEKGLKPLHVAIITSNEKFVKNLLNVKDKKVEIDSKAWCYLTAIDNEKIVSQLVEHYDGISIENCKDEFGRNPLHHAIINRNPRFITLFCALGCNVNSAANNGFTPIHFAVLANNVELMKKLLDKNASIDIKTMDGKTATYFAVKNRYIESASLLINDSNVDDIVDKSGSSALHIAVENDDERMVELLLQNDANIMCRNFDGKNLLHIAAENGYEKWITFFIEKGIDVNGVTNDKSTPLLIALQNNKQSVANVLLDFKANVNMKNNDWLSPLFVAIQHNNIELCKKLVSSGAHVKDLTLKNSSVLHFAVEYSDKNMVDYLLQHGAKLGARDCLGQNELHIASTYSNSNMLEYLLELGMDVNEVTLNRSTALHYALNSRLFSISNVEVLIKHGVAIDSENKNGDTALNVICRSNYYYQTTRNIIEHLLLAKADPNHVGSDKRMPLHSCMENHTYDISTALLLAKHGANCHRINLNGDSVLHLIIKKCGCACTNTAYIKEFLKLGANINNINDEGETPLHISLIYGVPYGSLELIGNLFEMGAVATSNKSGENVLHMAIKNLGYASAAEEIVKFILEKDVNLSGVTINGSNIIHYAAKYSKNLNILKMLLDKTNHRLDNVCKGWENRNKRFLINDKDKKGKTPLHIAATLGANSLVTMLLEYEAEIDGPDRNKNSAINLAIMENHYETVKLLLKKGASVTDKNKDGFSAYDLAEQKNRHIFQLLLTH